MLMKEKNRDKTMSEPRSFKQSPIWEEAGRLVDSITNFTDTLPKSEFYELKNRLKESVSNVEPTLEEGFRRTRRVDKIRQWIKANGILEECRDYLKIVETLKYAETSDIIDQIDTFGEMLKLEHRK